MSQVIESVDVNVPIRVAYDQWTQFETFPKFMEGVESVTQLDATRNHWKVEIGGIKREFDTEITEQSPEERIAWTTVGGDTKQAGVVTFHKLDETTTRVTIQMGLGPAGRGREGRRRDRSRRPTGQGRRRAVQDVHRGARRPDRRLARGGPARLSPLPT